MGSNHDPVRPGTQESSAQTPFDCSVLYLEHGLDLSSTGRTIHTTVRVYKLQIAVSLAPSAIIDPPSPQFRLPFRRQRLYGM
jgi:hypothetical protein